MTQPRTAAALSAELLVPDPPMTGWCWFCHREVPYDSLIAGYDTFEEQRFACNTCNDAIQWLNSHGLVVSRIPAAPSPDAGALAESWERPDPTARGAREALDDAIHALEGGDVAGGQLALRVVRERLAAEPATTPAAAEGLRERIEALPRWPVYSEEGEPPENTRYGRLVDLDDITTILAASPAEGLDVRQSSLAELRRHVESLPLWGRTTDTRAAQVISRRQVLALIDQSSAAEGLDVARLARALVASFGSVDGPSQEVWRKRADILAREYAAIAAREAGK